MSEGSRREGRPRLRGVQCPREKGRRPEREAAARTTSASSASWLPQGRASGRTKAREAWSPPVVSRREFSLRGASLDHHWSPPSPRHPVQAGRPPFSPFSPLTSASGHPRRSSRPSKRLLHRCPVPRAPRAPTAACLPWMVGANHLPDASAEGAGRVRTERVGAQ